MELKNPYAEPVNPWAEKEDHAEKKSVSKEIGSLINALVLFVSLSKSANKYDADFPGLQAVQEEGKNAQARAIGIMEGLLKEWKK